MQVNETNANTRKLSEEFFVATLVLLICSLFKLIPGEKGDYLYMLAILVICGLISLSRKCRDNVDKIIRNILKTTKSMKIIQLQICVVILSISWQSIEVSYERIIGIFHGGVPITQLIQLEISNERLIALTSSVKGLMALASCVLILLYPKQLRKVLRVFQNKSWMRALMFAATSIFLIQFFKTPSSLPDFFHTVFAGDELLSSQAGLVNYSDYVGQYSNFLTLLSSIIPVHMQTSLQYSNWLLIILQLVNVILIFYISIRLSHKSTVSRFFTFVILVAPFFGGSATLDWLQNIPSRSLIPTIAFLFFVLMIQKAKLLYVLLFLLFVSISVYNDFLTGMQLVISVLAMMVVALKDMKFRFKLFCFSAFLLIAIGPLLYSAMKSITPFDLLTTYFFSYGESGFAKEFYFLGPDVYIWGFALASMFHSLRTLDLKGIRKDKDANIALFASYLVLSTIPYCVGRSYSAQIWSSSAIYLIILFSITIKPYVVDAKESRRVVKQDLNENLSAINVFFAFPLVISFFTGFWTPSIIIADMQRIAMGTNNPYVLFATQIDPPEYEEEFLRLVENLQSKVPNESIGLLVPHGNLLSIKYGIRNDLVVNHPDSLILKNQIRGLCLHLNRENERVFITDKNLAVRMREVLECQELFQFPNQGEITNRMLVALYSKSGG